MPPKVGFGIIGAGKFAEYCLESYRKYLPQLSLVSIYDQDLAAAQKLADSFKIGQVSQTINELLISSVDALIILTPPNTHFELARQALEAGKHVLVEKPIAFNIKDAQTLFDLAEKNNLQLGANFVLRFHPFHQELQKIVADNRYGSLKRIISTAALAAYPQGHWYWDEKISGGFFLNTYCHFLDLFDYISGETGAKHRSSGDVESGHQVVISYNNHFASLATYLHASNNQESVQTNYWFENAVITLSGWLPETMTILTTGGQATVKQIELEKDRLYQQILADILAEFIGRIDGTANQPLITNPSARQSVVSAVSAAENPLK